MRSRAHRDSRMVDHRGDVMRVSIFHVESHDRPFLARPPVNMQALDRRQPLMGVSGQIRLMRADRGAADSLHIVERSA